MRLWAALALWLALTAAPALAERLRIATFSPDLSREGPGLLLRDITSGKDAQVAAAVQVIAAVAPDVLLLTGFDWDHEGQALSAFTALLADAGVDYPHRHASRPNRGIATGLDMDGDGRLGTADDAQGFGQFSGQKGMALLSRLPLGEVTDHSSLLWRDLPGNLMPSAPAEVAAVQRLSTTAHWQLPVLAGEQPLTLLAWAATPPVFGRGDRNARRNHDEAAFWLDHLPKGRFVLIGNTNFDPVDGEGRRQAMAVLLSHVQDPRPASAGGRLAPQTGANAAQRGDPALDTAEWGIEPGRPGNMRVDMVLPSPDLTVLDAGVFWPAPGDPMAEVARAASRHRLVWVDLALD